VSDPIEPAEEEIVDRGRVIQIGMRGSRFSENGIQYGYDVGYSII
jgi:guanidinopropionase